MDDALINLLVTLFIIAVIISVILSVVAAVLNAVYETIVVIWVQLYQIVQPILSTLLGWWNGFEFPAIQLPTIPTFPSPTPGNIAQTTPTPLIRTGELIPGEQAIVGNTGGDNLNCRADPTADANNIVTKLPEGTLVTVVRQSDQTADNFTWWLVETSDSTSCWVVEDWLYPYETNPTVTPPTVYPTPIATSPLASNLIIEGTVTDGNGHKLAGVIVRFWAIGNTGDIIDVTTTNTDGMYRFTQFSPEMDVTYSIEVLLATPWEDEIKQQSTYKKQIFYRNTNELASLAKPIELLASPASGKVVHNIDFADEEIISPFKNNLRAMGKIYYHTTEFEQFVKKELNFPDFAPPSQIQTFLPQVSGRYNPDLLRFGETQSSLNYGPSPIGLEWHENAHHLMYSLMPNTIDHLVERYGRVLEPVTCEPTEETKGDRFTNHGGFDNCYSGDGWAEGWAEFWACAMEKPDAIGICEYDIGWGKVNMENNWKVWDRGTEKDGNAVPCSWGGWGVGCGEAFEEYAVASLLWDLYDPKDTSDDNDQVDLTGPQLLFVFRLTINNGGQLESMRDVYLALSQAALLNEDNTEVSQEDLDQIFINHGFYADDDDDNHKYENEEVGWAGEPNRR